MMRVGQAVAMALIVCVAMAGCARDEQEAKGVESAFAERIDEADEVFKSREYEQAGLLFEKVAEEAEETGDTSAYVEACAMRARSYLIAQNMAEARPWLAKAAAGADETMPLAWSRYLGVRGRMEWQEGDNELATKTFKKMYDYANQRELWDRAVDAAHMVAITGNEEEKLSWSHKGIEAAEAGEMTGWLGPLWNNLGWNYYEAERYDEALDALKKAREYHYLGEAELPKLIADYSVGHVHRVAGNLDEAKSISQEVFQWAERLGAEGATPEAIEWIGFSRWELGEIALAEGDAQNGVAQLARSLGELERAGMPNWGAEEWQEKQARLAEVSEGMVFDD